ncbi:MAG TPA: thiol peroxidase [Candidatus Hydrogenedentes bacterium]|nr:thiol peroxidase [Candidatus Hydrogenedentota bacterium]
MIERTGELTFQKKPLTVMGAKLKPGHKAPGFSLLDTDLSVVTLEDSAGKTRLISAVPSLDTPVCDTQARRFNEETAKFGDHVVGYVVSADLPFAQKRWCGAAGIQRIRTLSDHRDMAFGDAYGVHIKELRLEQRAVFVVDAQGIIQYAEYVPELTDQPDYEAALAALREVAG